MALKIKLLGVLIFFTGFSLMAQYQKIPAGYRNGFYNYYHSQPDSALFYGRKLAENPEYASFLRQALHDDIFTNFLESTKEKMKEQVDKSNYTAWEEGFGKMMETCYKTVHALHSDTNDRLVKSVEPLYLFAEVQRSSNDLIKLSHLTRAFIKSMPLQKDLYQNKSATYALLIYMTIEREKKLEKLSNEFLTAIIHNLSVEQPIVNVNTSSSTQLNERAWYR